MIRRKRRRGQAPVMPDGYAATLISGTRFTLAADHPMRGTPCLICDAPVDGHEIAIMGAALLGGPACTCGAVPAELFIAHAGHLPVRRHQILDRIRLAVGYDHEHKWVIPE